MKRRDLFKRLVGVAVLPILPNLPKAEEIPALGPKNSVAPVTFADLNDYDILMNILNGNLCIVHNKTPYTCQLLLYSNQGSKIGTTTHWHVSNPNCPISQMNLVQLKTAMP